MHNFLPTLRRVATIFALITLVMAALSGGVVISNLIGRVEKLEFRARAGTGQDR